MAKYSAADVYALVSKHQLTDEQAAAIEQAAIDAPSLVIAGAGSGKTELMMVRVLYLVANGFARPDQILGLTFTRKAASELAARIQQGLIRLRESSMWPGDLEQDFLPAKIATYNSFGNEIFRANALRLGFESEAQLISEATAIQLAKEIVENDLDLPAELTLQLDTIAERIVALSSEMTDNLVSPDDLISYYQELHSKLSLVPGTKAKPRFAYTEKHLAALSHGIEISRLCKQYREQKFLRNYLDFADQVALSLSVADPDQVADYRFVLLDEYQDTSSIQAMLLAKLFSGKPVMAVGDPNQAIYGWRGASSANLAEFFSDFGPGQSFTLSTSWRSGAAILRAANKIAAGIPRQQVQAIELSAGVAIEAQVKSAIFVDQEQEATAICSWLASQVGPSVTAAILFRTKESIRLYSEQLTAMGVTHEITGLSALLEQPEILELISILRVLVNPEATVELMRLMTGAKYQLMPVDIVKLHQLSARLSRYRSEVEGDKPLTLVELIDEFGAGKHGAVEQFEPETIQKLSALGATLSRLRTQLALSPSEIAWLAVREFEIDIELYAHSDARNPLANLQAFIARIAEFETTAERANLSGFIAWLELARTRESFELPRSGAKKGVVQLMSIHAAKGLEWDLVAIPNMNQGALPTAPRDSTAWLSGGKLPPSFRLDTRHLVNFDQDFEDQKQFNDAIETYRSKVAEAHLIEERRLSYVAITRAARELFLTASYFKRSTKGERATSIFLDELVEAELCEMVASEPKPESRPEFVPQRVSWPQDPMPLRGKWQIAADKVLAADSSEISSIPQLPLLLAERERPQFEAKAPLPIRLSASSVVRLIEDPKSFAESILRPVPQPYSDAAATGTNFHANLEAAFLAGSELEISSWSEPEKKLGVNFLESRFANLEPIMVEQSLEFALGGTIVVCKLDAVFDIDGHIQIVDWKSGKRPSDEASLKARAVQLALYRVGLCRLLSLPPEAIGASFFFAADGKEEQPDLMSERELEQLLQEFRTARPTPAQ